MKYMILFLMITISCLSNTVENSTLKEGELEYINYQPDLNIISASLDKMINPNTRTTTVVTKYLKSGTFKISIMKIKNESSYFKAIPVHDRDRKSSTIKHLKEIIEQFEHKITLE